MDATKRVNDLIVILERFSEVLELENDALRNNRAGDVKELLEEKSALSRVYESRGRGLMETPEALNEVAPEQRDRLKELVAKADGLVAENARHLKISIESQKRVVEVIKDAVKEARGGPKTYSADGVGGRVNVRAASAPMAIDEKL